MELSFVKPVAEDFYCSICQSILRDPVLTECCGQHFCTECLDNWLKLATLICPHCRTKDFKHIKSLPMLRMINKLTIYCPMKSFGCLEKFRKDSLNEHLRTCDYILVQCSNKCGEMLFRKDYESHLLECSQRPIRMQGYGDITPNESHILHTVTAQVLSRSEDTHTTHTFALTPTLKAHLLLTLITHNKPRQLLTKRQDGTISLIIEKSEQPSNGLEVKIEQIIANETAPPINPLRSRYVVCDTCNHGDTGDHGNGVYTQKIFGHPDLRDTLTDNCFMTVTIATHKCTPR